jgi:hypothetical protein
VAYPISFREYWASFPGVNQPGLEVSHSSPSNDKLNNKEYVPPLPLVSVSSVERENLPFLIFCFFTCQRTQSISITNHEKVRSVKAVRGNNHYFLEIIAVLVNTLSGNIQSFLMLSRVVHIVNNELKSVTNGACIVKDRRSFEQFRHLK